MRPPSLLVLSMVLGTAVSQADIPGVFYVGAGLPTNVASFSTTSSTQPSATACKTNCQGVLNFKGFNFETGRNDVGGSPVECFCYASPTAVIAGTSNSAPGSHTYCFGCISMVPSSQPSSQPSGQPSSIPSEMPSSQPSSQPSAQPSGIPSGQPSSQPSGSPSGQPSSIPSESPSSQPSSIPSSLPSGIPSSQPSSIPSSIPSTSPSSQPSSIPSSQPSSIPSGSPSSQPSTIPSSQPSSIPSESPSSQPSTIPSSQPSSIPSESPSAQPSTQPSTQPSSQPSESPSANPSQGCENIRTDCGWGIFNPWTCRCDCPVGICLDNNEQCYHPCTDTINVNPWAGCASGWDCPWYPDRDSGHCLSEMHQPNNFEIYRTAKECCAKHYKGTSKCLTDSKNSHDPFPWPIHFPGTPEHRGFRPPEAEDIWGTEAGNGYAWFPDLLNELNCIDGNNYEDWMTEPGYAAEYLFSNSGDCCEKWFPALGSDCPVTSRDAVNPEAQDETWMSGAYPMQNYYFPDFGTNNCGFGWDYPAWYGINGYEKVYLFRTGEACCKKFFPTLGNCPYENTKQLDYSWTTYEGNKNNLEHMPIRYNHTYYPEVNAGTCVNGTDYPDWMAADKDFIRLYLFKKPEGCCKHWFTTSGLDECMANLIQSVYVTKPCPINRPDCKNVTTIINATEARKAMWYPDIDGNTCKNDGAPDYWMLNEDYWQSYLFNTKAQCCAQFDCS